MMMATGKIVWGGLYIAILFALWRAYGWKTMLIVFLMTCIAVACADQMTAKLMRPYFERLRPANIENPISELVHVVNDYRSGRYGFPSSHAANTFATATLLSLVFKRIRFTIGIFLWALINCYSRVYLGVHYPGDLLVGCIVGIMIGIIMFIITNGINAAWRGCHNIGKSDPLFKGYLGGFKFTYRAVDIILAVEIITIIAILVNGFDLGSTL